MVAPLGHPLGSSVSLLLPFSLLSHITMCAERADRATSAVTNGVLVSAVQSEKGHGATQRIQRRNGNTAALFRGVSFMVSSFQH